MNTVTKKQYRELMKEHGFTVSFKTVSFSDLTRKSAEVQIIKNLKNEEMPFIFFGEDHRKEWAQAIEIKKNNRIQL